MGQGDAYTLQCRLYTVDYTGYGKYSLHQIACAEPGAHTRSLLEMIGRAVSAGRLFYKLFSRLID